MNPTGKKLVSLFLVFSLMMLPTSLHAKKRGAKLIITKKDGQEIEGKLITVKPNSLLLLDKEGKDVSVDIVDIRTFWIVKKSKTLLGVGIGFFICGGVGTLFGSYSGDYPLLFSIAVAALIGVAIGGAVGKALVKDIEIQLDGMSDSEIQETLDKLRKRARIRDYK